MLDSTFKSNFYSNIVSRIATSYLMACSTLGLQGKSNLGIKIPSTIFYIKSFLRLRLVSHTSEMSSLTSFLRISLYTNSFNGSFQWNVEASRAAGDL